MSIIILEVLSIVAMVFCGILGFFINRLYVTMDKNGDDINQVRSDLSEHKIDDAARFISRVEFDGRIYELKNDIRGMISPLHNKIDNIDNFVRSFQKKDH